MVALWSLAASEILRPLTLGITTLSVDTEDNQGLLFAPPHLPH